LYIYAMSVILELFVFLCGSIFCSGMWWFVNNWLYLHKVNEKERSNLTSTHLYVLLLNMFSLFWLNFVLR
jgi:Na+-driven multidrug efflux pump